MNILTLFDPELFRWKHGLHPDVLKTADVAFHTVFTRSTLCRPGPTIIEFLSMLSLDLGRLLSLLQAGINTAWGCRALILRDSKIW